MAQISSVTSESLQAKIRQLLPSQQGFGEDLQASNVILPVVDLTETAQGSVLPANLQQAINYGGATVFDSNGSTVTIASTGGFYRLFGNASARQASGSDVKAQILLNNGSSDKIVWQMSVDALSTTVGYTANVDVIVFLRSTDSLKISTSLNSAFFVGSVYQIADINGNLSNPTGFTFE